MSTVCKFYVQGNCQKGSNCRFEHPRDQGYRNQPNNRGGHQNQGYNKNYQGGHNQDRNYHQSNYNQNNQAKNYNQNQNRNYNQKQNQQNYNKNYGQNDDYRGNNQNYNPNYKGNYNQPKNQGNRYNSPPPNSSSRNSSYQNSSYQNASPQNMSISYRANTSQVEQPVQFSFNKKYEEVKQQAAPTGFSFNKTFEALQATQTPSSGDQAPPTSSSSNLIHKKGAHDLYSQLDELAESDKCSFMAAKFEANKIPLMPPPKECC